MTTFKDGPAQGQRLRLHRAPIYLRVTHDAKTGKWDALNELEDTARPNETLYCYKHTGVRGFACGGRNSSLLAEYALNPVQPSQEIMRSNDAWSNWVDSIVQK